MNERLSAPSKPKVNAPRAGGPVGASLPRRLALMDGVNHLHEPGGALARPDPEEPVTHIYAEDTDGAAATRLAKEYTRRIRQILR